jgi:hypothetical protein
LLELLIAGIDACKDHIQERAREEADFALLPPPESYNVPFFSTTKKAVEVLAQRDAPHTKKEKLVCTKKALA